ncbi:PREDICTED: GATA zinc finger domain-containing protein 8 [Ceratosolen solmsi marchali]|uniref:Zinc finger CCCH domain-containing protein 3 n=1 Tax=Ceratosolen solmsi marchali TaxID=326594 RepID=A0AAJ7DU84_9HYME|nr:PREDICTED: GATA zinc finger domain-containing protein 8 [Ceratosolen solmsi marchali]
MEDNLPNEMSQLNCLIEKHKQLQERSAFKSFYESEEIDDKLNIIGNISSYNDAKAYNHQENMNACTMSKVFVNPNYMSKKNVIHINPRVQVKPSIYINPKLIQNITSNQNQEQSSGIIAQNDQYLISTNIHNKCSVHINPKLMNRFISKVSEKNHAVRCDDNILNNQNLSNTSIVPITQIKANSTSGLNEKSCILSNIRNDSSTCSNSVSNVKLSTNYTIQSKTKLVNNCYNSRRSSTSNLVALSQRKLVRIKKNPKLISSPASTSKSSIHSRSKQPCSGFKKLKTNQRNFVNSISQLSKINNTKLLKNFDRYKANWYNKIDKNVSKSCRRKISATKKNTNNFLGLVSIGGIMYKTSRNQLVRSNSSVSSLKRRRNLLSNKHSQYYVTKNGKQLLKIDLPRKKINNSSIKLNTSTSSVIKNYKTNASNKVKQRSLQILRNKMRKNNQPCLLYQRFGYCANQLAGTCPKVHDKKQVALCKNFLQGKCLLDNCQLSHNVGPEKMPTCKYFLDGCCTRDGCPYLHVKVSSKNPICVEFLRGYCPQGNECQKRHIHACPEFDKSGKCSKGKFCQYPHKSHLTETKRFKITTRRKNNETSAKQLERTSSEPETTECRKRYYDDTSEELKLKREKLLKRVKIIKDLYTVPVNSIEKDISTEQSTVEIDEGYTNCEQISEVVPNRTRPPIGPLPSYIPID